MNSIKSVQRFNSTLVTIKNALSGPTLKVYEAYIFSIKAFVDTMTRKNYRAFGATVGMLFSELPAVTRSAIYTLLFKTPPKATYKDQRIPVLLFHGAAGSCNYMHDLASYLEKKNYDVHVINLGTGELTNKMRKTVYKRINAIRKKSHAQVNIVAHSMGGYPALSSIFSAKSSTIVNGQVKLLRKPRANSAVGQLITLAMPYNSDELASIQKIGKAKDVYNVTAKYDVLMGNKVCALKGKQFVEVNAGHIGIVFEPAAFREVDRILSK